MNLVAEDKSEQNRAAFDPWTVVHLAAGLAAGPMNVSFRWSMLVSAAYEIVEQVVERREWGKEAFQTAGPESADNAFVDRAAFALGHRLGTRRNASGPRRG